MLLNEKNQVAKRKTTETQPDIAPVQLPVELVIQNAAALREQLLPLVTADGAVALDGSAVSRVDAAGLQVLASFGRSRDPAPWTWHAVSDPIVSGARHLDLLATLHLGAAAASSEGH